MLELIQPFYTRQGVSQTSMEKAITAFIHGRVQGVGFRAATLRQAACLGLVGWVRNRDDGSVEVFAQGDRASLETFLEWCHQGPLTARVTDVQARDEKLDNTLKTFDIQRD